MRHLFSAMKKKSKKKKTILVVLFIIVLGFLIPQSFRMPVRGATQSSYNPESFWFYPWGKSVTHKGVDVFASKGTSVVSSTVGIVLYKGKMGKGGNVVVILGPKWRIHYYAHLNSISTHIFSLVIPGKKIGSVGASGNAQGKSPHLHYAIATLIPYPWRIDFDHQGWKKMFYLNPIDYLKQTRLPKINQLDLAKYKFTSIDVSRRCKRQ